MIRLPDVAGSRQVGEAPGRRFDGLWGTWFSYVAVAALLVALPFLVRPFYVSTTSAILVLGLLALSLDLLLSTAGMPSLGQAAFFGLGAYGAGLVAVHYTANVFALLGVAVLAAVVGAAVTGWIVARSYGAYLLIVTVAIGELFAVAANQWRSLTGGSDGLLGIPTVSLWPGTQLPLLDPKPAYWVVLVIFVLGVVVIETVRRSPFGRSLRGIRDNEPRMRALGYRTTLLKYLAVVISAGVAGASGMLSVVSLQFASPADFRFLLSSFALMAVIIGGTGRWWGPVVGAAIIVLTRDLLPSSWQSHRNLVLGLIFIAVVYLLRGGVAGLVDRVLERMRAA